MPRTTFTVVLPLFVALTLLSPGKAVAGPPEGASGKMVLVPDAVAGELRNYRKAREVAKRRELLAQLGMTRDPRVAVALGEALGDPNEDVQVQAALSILFNQQEDFEIRLVPKEPLAIELASEWWQKHKADLRRRAAQLPR